MCEVTGLLNMGRHYLTTIKPINIFILTGFDILKRGNYFALDKLFTFLASLLFRLAALFLWMVPRFASLSIIEVTTGSFSDAALLSVSFTVIPVPLVAFSALAYVLFGCWMICHSILYFWAAKIWIFSLNGDYFTIILR